MFFKNVVATALLGASAVNAHLIMTNPVPYGKDSINKNPLAADGSDFPCKLRSGGYDVTKENTYAIGDSIPLQLQGSAVHGGGSCQISLTTDRQPSKDTDWMVIKSIEGGCPVNTERNLPGGAEEQVPTHINFTIPDGIDSGKYTMAWTWFNRIGDREMYMNCAPVTIGGGSSKRSEEETTAESSALEKRGDFPGMFVANINGCKTKESKDITFPNPGDDVEKLGEPSNLLDGQPACTGTPTFTAGKGGNAGGSSGGSGGSSGGSSPSAGGSAPTQTSSSSGGDSPASSASEPSAPAATQSSAPAPSNPGSGSSQSGSCETEGAWNCIDGSTFQRCAAGKWTEAQQMAAGTECSPGQDSQNLSVKAIQGRMVSEMRHRKRAAHGAHHHA